MLLAHGNLQGFPAYTGGGGHRGGGWAGYEMPRGTCDLFKTLACFLVPHSLTSAPQDPGVIDNTLPGRQFGAFHHF